MTGLMRWTPPPAVPSPDEFPARRPLFNPEASLHWGPAAVEQCTADLDERLRPDEL